MRDEYIFTTEEQAKRFMENLEYLDLLNLESISEEEYHLDFTCIKGDRTTI